MVTLGQLEDFLNRFMHFNGAPIDIEKTDPHMPNGLQVPGKNEIKRVAFAVSASLELFQRAHKNNCDAVVVHHGIPKPAGIHFDKVFLGRIGYLLESKISLFGYHYLLDAHPEIGNNIVILKTLGFRPETRFDWGWIGLIDRPCGFSEIQKKCEEMLSRYTFAYKVKNDIQRIAVISGGAAPRPSDISELINQKIDLYITGETRESTRELMKEAGISFIGGGHYYTEKFGILALKDIIETRLGIETTFIDIENFA